jgi:hypothetical protein
MTPATWSENAASRRRPRAAEPRAVTETTTGTARRRRDADGASAVGGLTGREL